MRTMDGENLRLKVVREKRASAQKLRQLAANISLPDDKLRLLQQAADLEAEADFAESVGTPGRE